MPQFDESANAVSRSAKNLITDSVIEMLRALMDGTSTTVFEIWKSERAAADATIVVAQFPYKPIMQRALKRSVQVLPDIREVTLLPVPEKKKDQPAEKDPIPEKTRTLWKTWIKDVLSRPGWEEEEDSFRAALEFWRERVKVDGTLYMKLPIGPDPEDRTDNPRNIVKPVRMDAIGTEMFSDRSKQKKVVGYKYEYETSNSTEEDGGESVQEEITAKTWIVRGGPNEGNMKMDAALKAKVIPALHMVCEPQSQNAKGIPLAYRMADAFLDLLSAYVDIRHGNKMSAHQILVAINNAGGSIENNPGQVIEIFNETPSVNVDLKAIGGEITMESLFKEEQLAEKTLYDLAHAPFVPMDQQSTGASGSGRAQDRLTADQQDYAETVVIKEKSFLKNLFFKMFVMENEVEAVGFSKEWIIVEHGDLVLPDKDLQLREAEVRNDIGDIPGALEALGDDPDEIEKKMTVIGDAKAAEAASQGTAGNPLEEEGEEDEVVVE